MTIKVVAQLLVIDKLSLLLINWHSKTVLTFGVKNITENRAQFPPKYASKQIASVVPLPLHSNRFSYKRDDRQSKTVATKVDHFVTIVSWVEILGIYACVLNGYTFRFGCVHTRTIEVYMKTSIPPENRTVLESDIHWLVSRISRHQICYIQCNLHAECNSICATAPTAFEVEKKWKMVKFSFSSGCAAGTVATSIRSKTNRVYSWRTDNSFLSYDIQYSEKKLIRCSWIWRTVPTLFQLVWPEGHSNIERVTPTARSNYL